MAEGLPWEVVENPEELFNRGTLFVQAFAENTGAELINPMDHPLEFAGAVARLNPRHPQSVFRKPGDAPAEYQDRYAMADNGMPGWAAPYEDVINDAAHDLGIRDRELGTTFQHDFSPQGHFDVGIVLEGANKQDVLRGRAMAEGIRAGEITVDQVVVVGTGRKVGPKEGHEPVKTGYGVAVKAVATLEEEYPDVFGKGGVPITTMPIRTNNANAREVVTEVALRTGAGRAAMTGSNIYGTWMRTDMATAKHSIRGLDRVTFGAGPDDPKAARTPLIWTAEVAQTQVSAAYLRHAHMTKQG